MKTTPRLLLAMMTAVLCLSTARAQIIYSNAFNGGAVNIWGTSPTVANNFAGGTNTALWNDVLGANDTGALFQNGTETTSQGDSWLLPFSPQAGYIYALTCSVTFSNAPGSWICLGFTATDPTNLTGNARFTDSVGGVDWFIANPAAGAKEQFFYGRGAMPSAGIANQDMVNSNGTWTLQVILDTTRTISTNWTIAAFVNGVNLGSTNYTYAPTNQPITAAGIGQNVLGTPSALQWNYWTLATTLQPFIVQEPVAATLNGESTFSSKVTVMADTNGGPVSYQWYFNGVPLTNGAAVSGANTNVSSRSSLSAEVLTIASISSTNAGDYYVVVTNSYGSATSSLAGLTVLTTPVITVPATPTNAIILYAGSGGSLGSSPTFLISASGAPPLAYQWLTNGMIVGAATNSTFTFSNCQFDSPTNITCIVSNSFGEATNVWLASYIAAPTAPYPQAVLAAQPLGFWRLNEPDDNNLNEGVVCHDYESGDNGIYTNVTLAQSGYNAAEPGETSMFVSPALSPSLAGRITGVDFAVTNASANFTVEAWDSCVTGGNSGGAPVVSEGTYLVNDTFALGVDTNSSTKHYQFYVRGSDGTVYKADDSLGVQADDSPNWHHLVGVCDETHTNVSLYVDGRLAARVYIPANAGNLEAHMPMAIGAGITSGAKDYNFNFGGYIDDVAVYPAALSAAQVAAHYAAPGNDIPVSFVPPLPPLNLTYLSGGTLTIPASLVGAPPVGYYWTNVTAGGVIASGQSTNYALDATLTISGAPAGLSGDQLELVVTNASGSTNWFVTLASPAAPVALDYSSAILYSNSFNGGTWSIGNMPLTAANILVGGTNTVWADVLGTNNPGGMEASGVDATTFGDSWLLPFTPHSGYVYTITASVTFSGNPGSWTGPGFANQYVNTNTVNPTQDPKGANHGRFTDDVARGYDWMILTELSGNLQYFAGLGTGGTITNKSPFFIAGPGTHVVNVVLDTTGAAWKGYGFVDGVPAGTNTYGSIPSIGAVGLTQNAQSAPGNLQWNYFTLSQTAPGGVPPYLLNPLPPTNSILLTNGIVTLPATAFGSAPLGYYWSDNSSVIASGSTNVMAPLPATLEVPAGTLAAGQLQLVVTNAYGTNITLISLINPNPGSFQYSVAGNQLTLSWPTNTGWTLQVQTNSLSTGISTNWVDVANSTTTNQLTVPVNQTSGSVFYRLILP